MLVASLDDLIRMKRASAGPRTSLQLDHLEALREEIDRLEADGIDPQQGVVTARAFGRRLRAHW